MASWNLHDTGAASLPSDAEGVLKLAARSLSNLLAQEAQGMVVVDANHRIVWISEGYPKFLPASAYLSPEEAVGRSIQEVLPDVPLSSVVDTGASIVADVIHHATGLVLISMLALHDESGRPVGGVVMAFQAGRDGHPQPLLVKYAAMQHQLDDLRRMLAVDRVTAGRRTRCTIASFLGSSPVTLDVKRQARRAAGTHSTVLLLGETGTGKEMLAQAIHAGSPRARGPFVELHVAAVPESLLEAEFFGVVSPGRAQGSSFAAEPQERTGKLLQAAGGTIFLDEVADMPLWLQAKFLRVLQEQLIEPVGAVEPLRVDVRIIAATSRDLRAMVAAGQFRADLYYRLNVLPIRVPPLRERLEDLDALADQLLADIAFSDGLTPRSLSAEALDYLSHHHWPGNVRELRNVLEQACLMSDDLYLTVRHLSVALPQPSGQGAVPQGFRWAAPPTSFHGEGSSMTGGEELRPLPVAVAELEAASIRAALRLTGGNKVAAARRLGIARATLYEKLAALGIAAGRSGSELEPLEGTSATPQTTGTPPVRHLNDTPSA
jgi:transcriptional regulator with PAS, ATPase and Fis domain